MKQLIFLVVLVPMFAADPQGIVVLKSSDLKSFDKSLAAKLDDRKAAMEEFGKAGDYTTAIVHREADGDAETESSAVLLFIESGQAILANGNTADSKVAVAEGDVVVIPAHLLHQVLVAPGKAVTYLVIRQQQSRPENATSSAQPAPSPPGKKPALGADLGSGFRACVTGEDSPDGTVVDGYRKMINQSFLGKNCIWKPETSPETVTTGSKSVPGTARPGADLGLGYRGCVAGDNSPAGTIVDGYRKVMTTGPFGVSCGWEKVQ
jgi:mannose-6-phosphate isomerase-like protein (cupin superfamily)